MDTKVNYALVGTFVLVLIAGLVLSVMWLSSGLTFESYTSYIVYMQESVTGVNIDSPVEFNGVSVGEVKSIELNKNNPRLVELILSVKSTTPVTNGTVATLRSRGVTGITFVSLQDEGEDLTPISKPPRERYPVIKTAPSLFMRLDTAVTTLSNKVSEVAESVNAFFDEDNRKKMTNILTNMDDITENLAKNNKRLSQILKNTSQASRDLSPLLRASSNVMHSIEDQTIPSMSQAIANINNVSKSLSELSAELKQNPSILIRGKTEGPLGPGEVR